jgi:hypothetical protein
MDSFIPHQHLNNHLSNPDRAAAVEWARDLMVSGDFVVFDSETTGLSSPVDFVEIAVVGPTGETLVDSLLMPSCRIEPGAHATSIAPYVHTYRASLRTLTTLSGMRNQ